MKCTKFLLTSCLTMMGLAIVACDKENLKDANPVEPQIEPPVIENAKLTGLNGENKVTIGEKVKFSADFSVAHGELTTYSLTVSKQGEILVTFTEQLSGKKAKVEKDLDLGLVLWKEKEAFKPEVTIRVDNGAEMYTEQRVDDAVICLLELPKLAEELFLVDNAGKVFKMLPIEGQKGCYRTTSALDGLGSSFKIGTSFKDNEINYDGQVWEFQTPDSGEYGIRWLSFDIFNNKLSKMIKHDVVWDLNTMANDGEFKVFWETALVKDCRLVLLNFPEGTLLQSDRFKDQNANTVRYVGETGSNFEVYFIPDTKWLLTKKQYIDLDELWVTGKNASLPMAPYTDCKYAFNWFAGHQCHDAANFIWNDDQNRSCLLYLKSNFELKLYSERVWAAEIMWKTDTPDLLKITEMLPDESGKVTGNLGLAGPSFKEEGLYMFHFNINTKTISLEKYNGRLLEGMPSGTAVPEN